MAFLFKKLAYLFYEEKKNQFKAFEWGWECRSEEQGWVLGGVRSLPPHWFLSDEHECPLDNFLK